MRCNPTSREALARLKRSRAVGRAELPTLAAMTAPSSGYLDSTTKSTSACPTRAWASAEDMLAGPAVFVVCNGLHSSMSKLADVRGQHGAVSMRNKSTAHYCTWAAKVEAVTMTRYYLFWTCGNLRFSLSAKALAAARQSHCYEAFFQILFSARLCLIYLGISPFITLSATIKDLFHPFSFLLELYFICLALSASSNVPSLFFHLCHCAQGCGSLRSVKSKVRKFHRSFILSSLCCSISLPVSLLPFLPSDSISRTITVVFSGWRVNCQLGG